MLEHRTELLNIEVTDDELRQILKEIGEKEFGGSDAVRLGDIVEATQADPATVASILARMRGKDLAEQHSGEIANHEDRLKVLEQWKDRVTTAETSDSAEPSLQTTGITERDCEGEARLSRPSRTSLADEYSGVFDFNTGKWHQYSLEFDRSNDEGRSIRDWRVFEYFILTGFLAFVAYVLIYSVRH